MRSIKVFCVVDPENGPLLDTVGDSEKKALHEFDMMQPVPWAQAQEKGFRVAEHKLIEV